MKRMGIFVGVVAFAFILTTFHVDNPVFANSCCGIEKVENDGSKDGAKGGIMEVAGESSGNDCPVCGQDADSKGQQKDVEHDGKTAHLCCEGCANAFNENPDKYSKSEHPKKNVEQGIN